MRPYSSPSARKARRLTRHLEASGHLQPRRERLLRLFPSQLAVSAPQPRNGDSTSETSVRE